MVSYREAVAITSIIIYAIILPQTVHALARKYFATRFPWLALSLFAILRIIGDAFQLALGNTKSSGGNKSLVMGAAICNTIGLGPLLLTSTRLLTQHNVFIHVKAYPNQMERALFTFELCTVVSTIVTLVGGVQSFKPANLSGGTLDATVALKAGICLYVATFVCIGSAAVLLCGQHKKAPQLNTCQTSLSITLAMMLVSMLLLAVRVAYSLLSIFDKDPKFSPLGNGNETIQLCLQAVPEWLIAGLYTLIALYQRNALPPVRENAGSIKAGKFRQILRYTPFVHWFIR
jgi:hypothetical protein